MLFTRLRRCELMPTLGQIKTEIASLGASDYKALRRWFAERDWEAWDREFEEDAKSGRLDFLSEEAGAAKRELQLRTL